MTKEELVIELNKIGFSDQSKIDRLEDFMRATLDVNKHFNLTAIKDEYRFRELMILDSAIPLKYYNLSGKNIIDVGTGAGYPGMVMATLSDGDFTLLDATNKKVSFYKEFASKFEYLNVNSVCDRAEHYAKLHRDEYDFAVARAVSELNILLEMIIPLLKVNGVFIALKGSKGLEELERAKSALSKLDAEVVRIDEYNLPESKEKRINILIKKTKSTLRKYPRDYSSIISKPL